jgi:hypothetical protein
MNSILSSYMIYIMDVCNWWVNPFTKKIRSSIDGGSYSDFTPLFWILKYLQDSIDVWNKNNGGIMVKVGDQQDVSILDIIYRNKHFEPINIFNEIVNEHISLIIQRFQIINYK